MIRDQNYNAKANPRVERTKATFIYQFLVNDDCDDLWPEIEDLLTLNSWELITMHRSKNDNTYYNAI